MIFYKHKFMYYTILLSSANTSSFITQIHVLNKIYKLHNLRITQNLHIYTYALHKYIYHIWSWITQIHELHKFMNYTNTWITQIHELHKYMIFYKHMIMNYTNIWITQTYELLIYIRSIYSQIYELYRYINYTDI